MKCAAILKTTAVIATFAISAINIPTQSHAEEYDMCELGTVPDNIKRKIIRRSDFESILRRMFSNCPDAALALTEAATASILIPEPPERNGDPDSDRPGDGPGPDDGGPGGGSLPG